MRKFFFMALAGLLIAQIGCKQEGAGIKTKNGYRFVNHTNAAGEKVKTGDQLTVNVFTWFNDSLVESTVRDYGGPQKLILPDTNMLTKRAPAFFEAFFLMAKGDSATVFQPIDSSMAKSLPAAFKNVKEIRYEIVIKDQAGSPSKIVKEKVEALIADYKANKINDLKKTASGLQYVIHEQGAGAPVKDGETMPTNYYGALLETGIMFDNSFDRGGPTPFTVGQLIPGFNEGMKLINHGGKATLFIPASLGYGEQGAGASIPPNANLVFYIEIP